MYITVSRRVYTFLAMSSTVLFAATILLSYLLLEALSENHTNHQSLRIAHEGLYKEVANVTSLTFFNTELVMRFPHYEYNHDPAVKKEPYCAECVSLSPPKIVQPSWVDTPIIETEYQIEDAVSDTEEARDKIHKAVAGLIQQHYRLQHSLSIMRYGDDALNKPKAPVTNPQSKTPLIISGN